MSKQKTLRHYVLDAGALIAQERRDPRVVVLFEIAADHQIEMVLPSVVLAQVWRNGTRQVQLARTLSNPGVTEAPLHHEDAKRVGELLRESATADVADAHVAVLAGRLRATVITSDSGDIAKLDPALPILKVLRDGGTTPPFWVLITRSGADRHASVGRTSCPINLPF